MPTPADIVARYNAGHSIASVARQFGLTPQQVRTKLHAAGVAMRPRGAPSPLGREAGEVRDRRIVDLIAGGLTTEEIGREMNLSVNTIKSHIRRLSGEHGTKTRAHLVVVYRQQHAATEEAA